jgi:hypothetical protein
LLYGAGIGPGVVGTTDARGEEPVERPIAPPEVFATLLAALGVDAGEALVTPDGRPVRLVDDGIEPVREVLRG